MLLWLLVGHGCYEPPIDACNKVICIIQTFKIFDPNQSPLIKKLFSSQNKQLQ